ncbi:MAG: sigma-54-dependent Fis family transcriptional regulator [Calditrichaeota bacterium]|nr:sigma-54-dependent Fis family transcriptional regulator [Calditrichota bacterium]RQW07866.1 MAG: sigma-54-dependent Fis family transcriptional regulator [Calditrichota bacterium]
MLNRKSKEHSEMDRSTIMLVEDNETMRLGIEESLKRSKFQVISFSNGKEALNYFRNEMVPVVITDLKMEPVDGFEILREIKKISPMTEILMISAYGTIDKAVKAMQEGAADFLTKPFSPEELRIRVKHLVEKVQQQKVVERLRDVNQILQDQANIQYHQMLGKSPVMQNIFGLIDRIAGQDSSVLITGESGTGKELVARAIHRKSERAEQPFITLNCGALNENLLESELFGHEKGAFTGAVRQKRGRFELADGGTLFLDEIGDISPKLQVKLLRAIQEQEFERVGGEITLKVDVRIIAATNRNLTLLVHEGNFREDLYYRLSVIPLHLPPLRERREDIPLLTEYFFRKLCREKRKDLKKISRESMMMLQNYSWPGNIRELENLVERLLVITPGEEISPQLIAQQLGQEVSISLTRENTPLDDALYSFERNMIVHALKKAQGVKNRAAKILGIKTSTLYYKMEKFGLIK